MKRNCNLELRLSNSPHQTYNLQQQQQQQQQEQLTIMYNGQISVCDVTEIQARAIIWLASKQMDRERYSPKSEYPDGNGSGSSDPISPNSTLQMSPGTSMKKSLQRFLQKRRHRQITHSPYHHNGNQSNSRE